MEACQCFIRRKKEIPPKQLSTATKWCCLSSLCSSNKSILFPLHLVQSSVFPALLVSCQWHKLFLQRLCNIATAKILPYTTFLFTVKNMTTLWPCYFQKKSGVRKLRGVTTSIIRTKITRPLSELYVYSTLWKFTVVLLWVGCSPLLATF